MSPLAPGPPIVNDTRMKRALALGSSGLLLLAIACGSDPGPVEDTVDSGTTRRPDAGKDTGVLPVEDSGTPDAKADVGTCADPDDLGGIESPKQLSPIDDKDASPPHKVGGIISSERDADAYSFVGNDVSFAVMGLKANTNLPNAELCVFIKCVGGTTKLNSCVKGTQKNSDLGYPGCCDATAVELDHNCTGLGQVNDSVNVTMTLTPKVDMCSPYFIEYNM